MTGIISIKKGRMKSALKLVILVFSFLALLSACGGDGGSSPNPPPPVSTPKWTWVSGSDTINQTGSPGAKSNSVSWIDSSDNLWLFGGENYYDPAHYLTGWYNYLWKYDATTDQWTKVSGSFSANQVGIYGALGVPASSNVPGARVAAVSWIDSSGKLWLFGGDGNDSMVGDAEYLNDLWKYDPVTNEWTWVSGSNIIMQAGIYGTQGIADPSNVLGARGDAVSWIDSSGNLWLFGGFGHDSAGYASDLNDLWKYDPASLEWTWVSGSNTAGQKGNYGTQGKAAASNVPGGRYGAVSWIDSSGNLWLFGGFGHDSAGYASDLNDLWKYDPASLEWTWVSGSNTAGQKGNYGTQGKAAASNVPGGRYGAVSWLDPSGNLWLFGGIGYDSAGSNGNLNDLWKYDPASLEWTWISGSSSAEQKGNYGTPGVASPSNVPGARSGAVSWVDSHGNLWLFGGSGWGSATNYGFFNDLWKIR